MGVNGATDQRRDNNHPHEAAHVITSGALKPSRVRELLINDLDILAGLYRQMPAEHQREFWQLTGSPADKMLYLMRWGGVEPGKAIVLCN